MYKLIALITGILISVMISINGVLAQQYGVFPATVIIHAVGVVFALLACAVKRVKPFPAPSRPGGSIWAASSVSLQPYSISSPSDESA